MSTTQTRPTKRHINGGTYRRLQHAYYDWNWSRWGVSVTERHFRGRVTFEVHRVDPDLVTFPLARFDIEQDARDFANREWLETRRYDRAQREAEEQERRQDPKYQALLARLGED